MFPCVFGCKVGVVFVFGGARRSLDLLFVSRRVQTSAVKPTKY